MSRYKAAIFDVDGTLLNTREGILEAIRDALVEVKLPPLKKEDEKYFIGPPIQRSAMQVYGVTKEEAQEFAEAYRNLYSKHEYLFKADHYDGILQLMKDLKEAGIRIAIATYKREDYALDIVEHFGFMEYAEVAHGADNFNKLTKSDIIRMCISEMGLTPAECVMIGDSDNDAIGADGIGCPFVGCTYGFGFTCDADVDEYPNIGKAAKPSDILGHIVG